MGSTDTNNIYVVERIRQKSKYSTFKNKKTYLNLSLADIPSPLAYSE